jgi:anaerobic carbon-monoxide dehydrogenase iron sulfur subunit
MHVIQDSLEGWSRPAVCLQCDDPMCLPVCPAEAISASETPEGDRVILVDAARCISCRRCVAACPLGEMDFAPRLKAFKCDLCGGSPKCVEFCFYGCLSFIELSEAEQAKRSKKVDRLLNRMSGELAKRDLYRRRRDSSLRAAGVAGPPEE